MAQELHPASTRSASTSSPSLSWASSASSQAFEDSQQVNSLLQVDSSHHVTSTSPRIPALEVFDFSWHPKTRTRAASLGPPEEVVPLRFEAPLLASKPLLLLGLATGFFPTSFGLIFNRWRRLPGLLRRGYLSVSVEGTPFHLEPCAKAFGNPMIWPYPRFVNNSNRGRPGL